MQGTLSPERHFNVYFFHLLVNLEMNLDAWKWNFYRANKSYLQFPGIFEFSKPLDLEDVTLEGCSNIVNCVGLELPANRLLSFLHLESLRKVEGAITMVKALTASSHEFLESMPGEAAIDSRNSWDDLDTCCPKGGKVTDAQVAQIGEDLERVPCDIPQEVITWVKTYSQEFVARYVMKQKPVIVVNCSISWNAQVHHIIPSTQMQIFARYAIFAEDQPICRSVIFCRKGQLDI